MLISQQLRLVLPLTGLNQFVETESSLLVLGVVVLDQMFQQLHSLLRLYFVHLHQVLKPNHNSRLITTQIIVDDIRSSSE